MNAPLAQPAITAADWLKSSPVFIDTETTGLNYTDDQIVDLCVIDTDGVVLFDTLIKPTKPIDPDAAIITGITDEMVKDAPTFLQVWARLANVLKNRLVITYNASFDVRMLAQSARAAGILDYWVDFNGEFIRFDCAMLLYAEHYGDWNEYRHSYRWQKLSAAARQCGIDVPPDLHRARADAELARKLVLHMASRAPVQTTTQQE
jgi:DNA polymerase III epsilon subunit-like protein